MQHVSALAWMNCLRTGYAAIANAFAPRFSMQSVVTQHQDQLSQHAAGTAEAAEAHATFDERMRQLAVQPPAAVVTTTPLTPPRPSSVTSLPSSSQHSRPSSTQSNMLGECAIPPSCWHQLFHQMFVVNTVSNVVSVQLWTRKPFRNAVTQ